MQVIVIECDAIVCVVGLNRKWESQLTSSLISTIICNSLQPRKTEKLSYCNFNWIGRAKFCSPYCCQTCY